MLIGVFDLFSIGIGPSSSHTVGPMRAARDFVRSLVGGAAWPRIRDVRVDLYGSLAATGQGHGTFTAILLGLEGYAPEEILPAEVDAALARIARTGTVHVGAQLTDPVVVRLGVDDLVLRPLTVLPRHANGMRVRALDAAGAAVADDTFYSIGGGSVVREGAALAETTGALPTTDAPFPFETAAELLAHAEREGASIADVMRANELATRSETELHRGLDEIWAVMEACKDTALTRTGLLPGGLEVRRRAPEWHRRMCAKDPDRDPRHWQEWLSLVALAVNEENASGGRVVTAPTNGAAGIIPAVLFYATHYLPERRTNPSGVVREFLLAAGAIGALYKRRASISGAEVGCQGEVGSAASMAAAGLAQVLGGTPQQVENAAEIAMEHNLGLTCDPIGGLVQIPCIERNAVAAAQAVHAAQMALMGDGTHHVSLDDVIATMRETGRDMHAKYKETAMGGLAVHAGLRVSTVEC